MGTKYCWLQDDLTFSASWDKEEQDKFVDRNVIDLAERKGWRIIEYKVVVGSDFEFPYGAALINTKSTK